MSLPFLSLDPHMYVPRTPSRPAPSFQDRSSKCFAISGVPAAVAGFETPDWCQLEHYPPYPADFDAIGVELPQPTSCESLNSSCPRQESSESLAGSPHSKELPRESSESTGSLAGFDFAEVVETSGFWGGRAMEPSNPEDEPQADPAEDDSAIAVYNQYLQGLQIDNLLATAGALLNPPAAPPPDAPAGTIPVIAGTPGLQPLTAGERFPQAGGSLRAPSLSEIPAAPRWRINPFYLTALQELERATGPSISQVPFPPTPHALPVSLPPLGREIPHPGLANLPTQQQAGGPSQPSPDLHALFTEILGPPNPGANPSSNLAVSPPVTFDLHDLGGGPSSGARFDEGFGRSVDSLMEFARRGIAAGGSLPAPPRLASNPPAPLRLPPAAPPQEVATLRFPSQPQPYLTVTFPEPALTSLSSRQLDPLDLWRREPTLPDSQLATLPELLARLPALSGGLMPERLAREPDPPERIPELPSGGLQRVASAPPLGGATPLTLVGPNEPPLESPGVVSAVCLASSEGSPAATSSPAKQPRKRNPRGKGAKKQVQKAPSLERPPSPMADPVRNPPQNAPQDPGGDQGAAADPTSMDAKRLRSMPSHEEPGAEGGGQDTWRAVKKARDVSPGRAAVSTHSSGGASAAGSRSMNAAHIESEAPKEGGEEKTQKRRLERKRKLHELRAKPCGCTQDWPNDVQKLRAVCNDQSVELRSIKMQQNLMNRRDSEQTQEIEELRRAVEDLTRALDAARGQLARQAAVPLPRDVEGARAPAVARASQPRGQAERRESGSEEESSRGTGSK